MQTGAMFSENNFRDLSFSFLQWVDAEFNLTAHVVNFLHEHLAVLPTKQGERKHIRKDALCHFSQGSLGIFVVAPSAAYLMISGMDSSAAWNVG